MMTVRTFDLIPLPPRSGGEGLGVGGSLCVSSAANANRFSPRPHHDALRRGGRGGVPRPRRTGARMMTVQFHFPFPDVVQRDESAFTRVFDALWLRGPGIVSNAVTGTVPVLRRITQACCTAPGTRAVAV